MKNLGNSYKLVQKGNNESINSGTVDVYYNNIQDSSDSSDLFFVELKKISLYR